MLYEACLRPILEYASEVWGDVSRASAYRLTIVQHHAVNSSLGVNRRDHMAGVCVEAQVPPRSCTAEKDMVRAVTNQDQT